jgi:hypothetical protein
MDNKLRRPSFNSSAENHTSPSTSTSYPLARSASGVGTSNNTSTGNQAQKVIINYHQEIKYLGLHKCFYGIFL